MHYDPIKRSLGGVFHKNLFLKKVFFRLLDMILLRTWYIRREINEWSSRKSEPVAILDAGSGFGQYLYFLARKFTHGKLTGVEVDEHHIRESKEFFEKAGYGRVTIETADLVTFSRSNEFDLIISVDVMEHIEEDVKVFKNFHQALKSGGMLLISTPSDKGGSDVHDQGTGHNNDGSHSFIGEHVRDGYSIEDISGKLSSAGFQKIAAYYSYGKPGSFSWRISMKYPILMAGTSKFFFLVLPFYFLVVFPVAMIFNYLDTVIKHKSGTGLIVKAWK